MAAKSDDIRRYAAEMVSLDPQLEVILTVGGSATFPQGGGLDAARPDQTGAQVSSPSKAHCRSRQGQTRKLMWTCNANAPAGPMTI
jgi:hypothetical protein